jgi:hypothetical protein
MLNEMEGQQDIGKRQLVGKSLSIVLYLGSDWPAYTILPKAKIRQTDPGSSQALPKAAL